MKYGRGYTLITGITGFLGRKVLNYKKIELDYILNLLKNKKKIRLLDYGCNTAFLLDNINKKYPSKGFDLCGADINPHALKYARKKYKDFTFFNINNKLFNTQKFDIIIISHVLEHIKDRNKTLINLKKVLKNNGSIIIALPQERIRGDCTPFQILYNFLKFNFENPHVVKMNYQDLNNLLNNNELYIKKHIYAHFFYPFKSYKQRFDSWSLITEVKKT